MIRFDFPRSLVQGQGHQNENGLIGIVIFLSLSTIKIIISIQYYIAFLDIKLLKADDLFSTESICSLIRFPSFFQDLRKKRAAKSKQVTAEAVPIGDPKAKGKKSLTQIATVGMLHLKNCYLQELSLLPPAPSR